MLRCGIESLADCIEAVTVYLISPDITQVEDMGIFTNSLLSVPISNVSMCYIVSGEIDKFFNLISGECVAVNAHYVRGTDNPNITLTITDTIGVRAVSNSGTCVNIKVSQEGCRATVDGEVVASKYSLDGITVYTYKNHVRIAVPNCGDTDLVMSVFCITVRTEDPFTRQYHLVDSLRFVVVRGQLNHKLFHGLIGISLYNSSASLWFHKLLVFFQVNFGTFQLK